MSPVKRIAFWLRDSRAAVAFTDAGITTESGIPDFRSPGGVWPKSKPVLYQRYLACKEARYESWRLKSITHVESS